MTTQPTHQYPPPPVVPSPDPADTREAYGLRILAFLIQAEYPDAAACACSDEQLALALHVAPIASAVYVHIAPDKTRMVDYRTVAADAIADAKRRILAWQRIRAACLSPTVAAQLGQAPASTPSGPPSSGARLIPPAPTQPPAGYALTPARTVTKTPAPVDIAF